MFEELWTNQINMFLRLDIDLSHHYTFTHTFVP